MAYRKFIVSLFLLTTVCTSLMTGRFGYHILHKPNATIANPQPATHLRQLSTEAPRKAVNLAETSSNTHRKLYRDPRNGTGQANPVETATYIIFKEGRTIKAKNRATGEIEVDDANFVLVIDQVLSRLAPEGGKLFIRKGHCHHLHI